MKQVSYVHTLAYTTVAAEPLADLLIQHAGHGFSKAYLVGSGREANDSAMKLARQYFFEKGEQQRKLFISRRQAYHENTVGAMSLTTAVVRIEPYHDILPHNVSYVSPCYPYQYQRSDETMEAYVSRLAQELEDEFQLVGPSNVISFVAETVSGSVCGCIPPAPGYLQAMREVCGRHGALLILDQIMCGLDRIGAMFA
jgi:adenosylmethionine-8-amino-7-oxononanoate aminotransferase